MSTPTFVGEPAFLGRYKMHEKGNSLTLTKGAENLLYRCFSCSRVPLCNLLQTF